jgi:outer membrane protein assembly factor BamB
MRIRAALSVAVLVWSAAACTGGSEPAKPRASAPPGEVVDKAEEPPLPFGARPLWTDQTKGVPRYADRFALHGDSVIVVSGPKGGEADRLSVMGAATGRVQWSVGIWKPLRGGHGDYWDGLGAYDPVPQVVDRGGDWGVLVRTTQNHYSAQPAHGMALLSGEDGSVLWRQPLVAEKKSPGRDGDVYPDLLLSDGRLAVMSLRPLSDATVADVRLAAVDARTGKRLWTRSGIRLAAVASGFVIASESQNPASTPLDATASGSVTVLDAATGRTRWSLRDRMATARMAAAANGLLLVRDQQGMTPKGPVLLDMATGGELDRMPDQAGNCADDRSRLIACEVLSPEPRLLTVRADERRVRVAGHPPPEGVIQLVQDGRIYFVRSWNAPGQEIDRSGTPLVSSLPKGVLLVLSDNYAVFHLPASKQENEHYQVYRVG